MMKALLCTAASILLVALPAPVEAMVIDLGRPSLALPQGFPKKDREQIQQVLENPDCGFLGGVLKGSGLFGTTELRYAGGTKGLNEFLRGLANCEGAFIRISFAEWHAEAGDWNVHHSATERGGFAFHVRININSEKISLSDLVMPEIWASHRQGGAGQPATAVESKPEGKENPEPESEKRPK